MNKYRLPAIIGLALLNLVFGLVNVFPVIAGSDLTASFTVTLVISNMRTSGITNESALISWETNDYSTSQIFYDTQYRESISDYRFSSSLDQNLRTSHTVLLSELSSSANYHYRIKSITKVGEIEFIAISEDAVFRTANSSGSGSNSTNTSHVINFEGLVSSSPLIVNNLGVVQNYTELTSLDGKIILAIPAGTILLDDQGRLLDTISLISGLNNPGLSQDRSVIIIGFQPRGASFTPQIKLTFKYSNNIPVNGIFIAYWNNSTWNRLESKVDVESETISTLIQNLGVFGLMVNYPSPTHTSTPSPMPPVPSPSIDPVITPFEKPTSPPTQTQPVIEKVSGTISLLPVIIILIVIFLVVTLLMVKRRH
jgi:hypothetical protein